MAKSYEAARAFADAVVRNTPQAQALGIALISLDADGAVTRMPYDEKLVGDPATGVIAGGAVTTQLDHCCAAAVHAEMDKIDFIATLDLRIDYMRSATPGKDIFAKAFCYKLGRSVAFVRAVAYDSDPADPVAAAQAVFMLTGAAQKPAKEASAQTPAAHG